MPCPKSIIDIEYLEEEVDFSTIDIDKETGEVVDIDSLRTDLVSTAVQTLPNLASVNNCPRCGKPLVPAIAIDASPSSSFAECPNCGTLVNRFDPIYYQQLFFTAPELTKGTAGGFGCGKSRANLEYVIKHLLLIPKARVAVLARTYPALEGTFVKEFYAMLPKKLVRHKNDQKHQLSLTNGSELFFRSFDDPTKLKSMNLTLAVIVEASDVPYSGYTMIQSRIRNTAAMIPYVDANGKPVKVYNPARHQHEIKYKVDARHILLETNPDSGWVKTKYLLVAGRLDFFGEASDEGYKFSKDKDPTKYLQVISTSANPFLPPTYEAEQSKGKSKAYIAQFFKGSFNFSSNLVFPNLGTCIVSPKELPREFDERGRRVRYYAIGLDYGINDPTHIIYSAFSTETKKFYVFGEVRMNNSDIKAIAKAHRKALKEYSMDLKGLFMMPLFDGRSYNKRESGLVTIGSMFEDEGLFFKPSFTSHEARMIKMNALINYEQMEIFSSCEFLIDEGLNYKFKVDKRGNVTNKPVDGNDHGITALEFVVVELPHNLKELKLSVYLPAGTEFKHDTKLVYKRKKQAFNPLEDDRNENSNRMPFNNLLVTKRTNTNLSFDTCGSFMEDEDTEYEDVQEDQEVLGSYIPGH